MSGLWAGLVTGVRGAIRSKAANTGVGPLAAEGPGIGVPDSAAMAPRGYSP